jgi:aarF domain-containing kinase
MGATDAGVDYTAFSRDLEAFFGDLDRLQGSLVVAAGGGPGGPGLAASLEVDQAAVNRLALELVRIGEAHGVRFPPDFGLLLKQSLYLDRYVRVLAPGLQVLTDERVQWRGGGDGGGGGGFAPAGAGR